MDEPFTCPVCSRGAPDLAGLASHLVEQADTSDGRHVMWLNRTTTKHRVSPPDLMPLLAAALSGDGPAGGRIRR